MKDINRRDLCVALSSFAMLAGISSGISSGAEAQTGTQAPSDRMAVPPPPGSPGDKVLADSRAFRFDELPVVKTGNGETRAVIRGVLPTGEAVELHETRLLPGHMPHPPHRHRHSEFMLIREGTMEFDNDGKLEQAGPGGVFFAASNKLHGLKNVGTTTANYFVIAIGREGAATPV